MRNLALAVTFLFALSSLIGTADALAPQRVDSQVQATRVAGGKNDKDKKKKKKKQDDKDENDEEDFWSASSLRLG